LTTSHEERIGAPSNFSVTPYPSSAARTFAGLSSVTSGRRNDKQGTVTRLQEIHERLDYQVDIRNPSTADSDDNLCSLREILHDASEYSTYASVGEPTFRDSQRDQ